ncbi:MAG: hypothetical protein ACRD4S_01740 [Candidatus Acidiferrales bacterium]
MTVFIIIASLGLVFTLYVLIEFSCELARTKKTRQSFLAERMKKYTQTFLAKEVSRRVATPGARDPRSGNRVR